MGPMSLKKFILVLAFAFLSVFVTAPAANAAALKTIHHGDDVARAYYQKVLVEDRECDSNPVRSLYYLQNKNNFIVDGPYQVKDNDGCGGVNWIDDYGGTKYIVYKFKIQEKGKDGVWRGGDYVHVAMATLTRH